MKSKLKKNKNRSIKTIIVFIVLFGLFLPQIANAQLLPRLPIQDWFLLIKGTVEIFKEMTPANVALAILTFTANTAFELLSWVVRAAGDFFNAMLDIGFKSHLDIVKAGWRVTRDFANMFFILFLVIVAFTTILRLPRYGIKDLLPKVIIIALLINFSLVICSVIIDFSNITADFFINETRKYASPEGGISGRFADSLNLMDVHTGLNCNKFTDPDMREKCMENVRKTFGSNLINFILSMTIGTLVMLVAAFALFAGAILLLIRIVVIWFLLMFIPLVFICYIMPGLRKIWQMWWSTFLRWCFFAPAYAFFIWLAMKVSLEGGTKEIADMSPQGLVAMGVFADTHATNPGNALIHYFFVIALLLGGLIAASKFGIYGAGATLNIARRAGRGAKTWAARTTMRPIKTVGRTVGAGALTAGGALFGATKLGRRMKARATQIRRRPEEYPEHKRYAALLKTMSDRDAMKEMMAKAITPDQRIRKLLATREAAGRGLLRTATKGEAREAMKTFDKFKDFESLEKLKETRADAIVDAGEQEKVVQKVTQEGNLNKIPAVALEDDRLVSAITKFASAVQIESLRKVSPQHKDNLKDILDRTTSSLNYTEMKKKGIDPHADKIQYAYASQAGDVKRFVTAKQKIDWAKTAGPDGLKRMTTFDVDVAVNIPTAQLKNTLEKMENDAVVKAIVAHLKATPAAPAHDLATKDRYISNLG